MRAPIPLSAFTDNYIWVITDIKSAQFLCIDPGDSAPVLEYARTSGQTLSAILLTHHHSDHIGGVDALRAHFPEAVVYAPEDTRISGAVERVREGDSLSVLDCHFEVLETPGHTATHISLLEPNEGWLFCGDTLFSAGCGRVFDSTAPLLFQSLTRLKALPADTRVFPAHEYTRQNIQFALHVEPDNIALRQYDDALARASALCSLPSTIELEKAVNPFLRTESPGIIACAQKAGLKAIEPQDIFVWLRNEKNDFKPV